MKYIVRSILLLLILFSMCSCTETANTEGNEWNEAENIIENNTESIEETVCFDYTAVPSYQGKPYAIMNGNHPYNVRDNNLEYVRVSALDDLGRCQDAEAILGPDTLPEVTRGSIGMIRPSGWHTVRYDDLIEGNYLYNRCHLIAFEVSGIDADEEILVTGTRYMNVVGMLPFENQITSYIRSTGNHVYYHATPVFINDELVCRGVLLEAKSIEEDDLEFCVFCYNVQPGITIDYTTGESEREEQQVISRTIPSLEQEYVLNTNTKRFHYPECDSVSAMKEKNKQITYASREEIIESGYQPCAVCNP